VSRLRGSDHSSDHSNERTDRLNSRQARAANPRGAGLSAPSALPALDGTGLPRLRPLKVPPELS
jgi:hypothetical protein